jgi:hypothetical protein
MTLATKTDFIKTFIFIPCGYSENKQTCFNCSALGMHATARASATCLAATINYDCKMFIGSITGNPTDSFCQQIQDPVI